ncbi:MAG TPA: hypothetical protein VES42_10180 [Pilimelia sp.]|nr:hypothetical protein [Pilimelia sp.]
MDVELTVPQTTVGLVPGVETRVRVEVGNRSGEAVSLRLAVARSRAGAWAHTDPAVVDLAAGGSAPVDVVFRPPADVPPSATLLPFTVQAEDLRYGTVAGRATGLLGVREAERLDATIVAEPARRRPHGYAVTLVNRGDEALTLAVTARLDPPGGRVEVTPAAVDVPGAGTAAARIEARPRVPLIGTRRPYAVLVSCRDAVGAADEPPLATVEATGTVRPRLTPRAATVLAVVLVLAASAAGVWRGGLPSWLPGRDGAPGGAPAAEAPVRRPYAQLDVFPRRDGEGRAAAQAALEKLRAANVPVRLVDSTTSAELDDPAGGFFVLLHDDLGSLAEANSFCTRYAAVAPKCEAVP